MHVPLSLLCLVLVPPSSLEISTQNELRDNEGKMLFGRLMQIFRNLLPTQTDETLYTELPLKTRTSIMLLY